MDLSVMAAKLAETIQITMNPLTSAEDRRLAYTVCEKFMDSSTDAVPCGLLLAKKENSSAVRRFGFQLIEASIKNKWNTMTAAEKKFIKDNILKIVVSETNDILNEEVYIKTIIARIIVEMIKREWPQQWLDMLQELNDICNKGDIQKELVLLVFSILADEVNNDVNIPTRRKKDIFNTLILHLDELFPFFLGTLKHHYSKYNEMNNSPDPGKAMEARIHCQISLTAIQAISSFIEWAPWCYLTNQDTLLLKLLCTFLRDVPLRSCAAECLLLILNRKGKPEFKKPFLVLFSDEVMESLFAVASSISDNASQGEDNYLFLKQFSQVLVDMGLLLSLLWEKSEEKFDAPPCFEKYLNGILFFTKHPSLVIFKNTTTLWLNFFQHPYIPENPIFRQLFFDVVRIMGEKLIVIGLPSKSNSPSCYFSRLDFMTDKEFLAYSAGVRSQIVVIIRVVTELQPELVFRLGAEELLKLVDSMKNGKQVSDKELIAAHLEGIASYLDNVGRILLAKDAVKLCKVKGQELMTVLLDAEIQDPVIFQPFLSCLSTTIVFLGELPEMIWPLLKRLFNTVLLEDKPVDVENKGSVEMKSIRRHACACIFNVCKSCPKFLLPVFDDMYNHIKNMCQCEYIGFLEQNLLMESLIILSNEFHNYQKQSNFIKEIVLNFKEKWDILTKEMYQIESFVNLIGVKEPPSPLPSVDKYALNRINITFCINSILGIVRRSKAPEDKDVARNGGFINDNFGHAFVQCPAVIPVLPLLEGIFLFIKCINELHNPAVYSQFHSSYSTLLDLTINYKRDIVGIEVCPIEWEDSDVASIVNPKLKNMVHYQYELCLQVLNHVMQNFGLDFYSMQNLSSIISQCLFSVLEHLPDYKMRQILHVFIKPFICSCPPSYYHIIIPVFKDLGPFMLRRLSTKWDKFRSKYGVSPSYEDEMTEFAEIMEDQLNRLLTREYIDVIGSLLRCRNSTNNVNVDPMDEESEVKPSNNSQDTLSELGILVLRSEELQNIVVTTVFIALHWLDTVTSLKSGKLCSMAFKQLHADGRITSKEETTFLLEHVICGLKELGEHDANQSLLLNLGLLIYTSMRPIFHGLDDVLIANTGCARQIVENFDKLLLQPQPNFSEKKKRECFKNIIAPAIGMHIGQQHKYNFQIQNLPFMSNPRYRPKSGALDETEQNDLSLCKLFSSEK